MSVVTFRKVLETSYFGEYYSDLFECVGHDKCKS